MRMEGYVDSIHRNYGVIKSNFKGYSVKYLFYIFPDMLEEGSFYSSKKVTFSLTNTQIRGVNVWLAYDVQSVKGEQIQKFKILKKAPSDMSDYQDFVFKNFYKEHDDYIIDQLKSKDLEFKEFVLKWVLFLESRVKECVIKITNELGIEVRTLYQAISENSNTSKIHKDIFQKLKKNYLFRDDFKLLEITRGASGDVRSFEIVSAPLGMYLENTTIDELGKIVKVINDTFFQSITIEKLHDERLFINNTVDMFIELSIIRNACAHGNPLVPLILDDNYSPSYLHDLSSEYPEFNSGNDVREWKLFEPIRWTTRQLTKIGIAPHYRGALQLTGLYTAKYILINPARRSFFSFLFILEYYFKFINRNKSFELLFRDEFNRLLPYFGENKPEDSQNIYVLFPKGRSVFERINSFIYVLYWDESFWLLVHRE